ncbi:MAG: hypothetical protein IPI35_24165 [Deltaproteobacteria bacterium]|nr:hypothetical protein [Deltaproteobacteria bacterium]
MKLQWTHAELLTALAAPARRATDGVARALGLRAEGAEDTIGGEVEPPRVTPPLRPDAAWAASARALVRPGWATPSPVKRHVTLDTSSKIPQPTPPTMSPGASRQAAAAPPEVDPFEPLGAIPIAPASPMSASLGFEPLNHPLLNEAPRAERAVYELGAPPARASWPSFDLDQAEPPSPTPQVPHAQAPASLEFEPSQAPSRAPGSQSPPSSGAAPQAPASLEFEPSVSSDRVAHTHAALAPAASPEGEPPTRTDLEGLGDAFSDPFVAWRPGGVSAAPSPTPDDAPLPTHTTRLPLHPAPRHEPPAASTMELQGAEAPRPLRLRDLGRAAPAAAPAAAPRAAAPARRAPLDELFDAAPPELEALPEGLAFAPAQAFTPRAAAPSPAAPSPAPAPAATPSPARLRPAPSEAFEPESANPAPATKGAPSAPQAPQAAAGLPATPPPPTAAPQAAAGLDRDSLEEAMTEVLRDAARQHGLEV